MHEDDVGDRINVLLYQENDPYLSKVMSCSSVNDNYDSSL